MRAQHREQRLGLADGRPEVALRVLDQQRRRDPVGVGDRRDLAEVGRVAPTASRSNSSSAQSPPLMSPVRNSIAHVADAAAGHRGPEPLVVGDDPVRQVAAVRAAGHAEAIAGRRGRRRRATSTPASTSRVGPGPQSRWLASLNVLAVALRATRVAVEDADPVRGEDLELPHRRPAVERVRPAVDLGRRAAARPSPAGMSQPWMSRPSTVDVALDRLAELELGQDLGVEARSAGAAAPRPVEQPAGRASRSASSGGRRSARPRPRAPATASQPEM